MTLIEQLKADVEEHGEVHAIVEETPADVEDDAELEIRQGTATFKDGYLTLDNGQTTLRVDVDDIVSWYKPVGFFHT